MEGYLVYYSDDEGNTYFVKVYLDKIKALEHADTQQKEKNKLNIDVDYYVARIDIVE